MAIKRTTKSMARSRAEDEPKKGGRGKQPAKAQPEKPKIPFRERARRYTRIAATVILLFLVYLIASIFTRWTGILGGAAKYGLVGHYGGGVLILLFFFTYVCLSIIAWRNIPRLFQQFSGTVALYFSTTLLLGMLDLSRRGGTGVSLLYPGNLGRDLASWTFENIGALGTTFVGLLAISFVLFCFGFMAPFYAVRSFAQKLYARFAGSSKPRGRGRRVADRDDRDEYDDEEGEPEDGEDIDPQDVSPLTRRRAAAKSGEQGESDDTDGLPSPEDVLTVDRMEFGDVRAKPGQFPPPPEIFGGEANYDDEINEEMARPWGERIIDSLAEFGIDAELAEILIGPTVIQFRIQPPPGVKVNRIVGLANDLALALAVTALRVEAPIPGKPYVGIEIPNPKRRGITLRSIIEEPEYQETEVSLPLPMGVTINGDPLVIGLEDLPHLLVAGTTGSGKSVFVNGCIVGLCSTRRPDELKMVLVDPKRVEMAVYEKLPHILTPPVTDPKKAIHVLAWAIREMDRRYSSFAAARVRNLASYNALVLPKDKLPHIVIVVDELADLMMTAAKEVEDYICRLAQMARATGIHLMLATQRPSVNVITGLIKANVPARVAFTLPSMMDSRTILDTGGAEKLLGKGDMLFLSTQNPKPVRIQSPWIDEKSIARWLAYLINMFGEPVYTDIDSQSDSPSGFEEGASFDDALLEEAVKVVTQSGIASASGLQRRLRIGFTRAGRLVDMMETAGIIGPPDGARPREILVDEEEAQDIIARLRGE